MTHPMLSNRERAIRITKPSVRTDESLRRCSGAVVIIDGRIMPRAVMLAGALLALLVVGGCRDQGKDAAAPGNPAAERAASEESKTPYYYGLIEEYQSILAGDPHNLAAIIALGNAFFDAGQWKQALQHYQRALQLDPANADVVTDMGTCYRNLGMFDRAIAEYERSLKMEPTHQNALFNLGVVYGYDRKDYAKAIRYWEQLLHVSPKHPRAAYLQATMAQFKKEMRKKPQ